MSLLSVVFGDVTGDPREEAIVVLSAVVKRAPAAPNAVYIYTLQTSKPQLLWAFMTGDKNYGGLRRAYADRGELVLELYGKNKTIGSDLYADDGSSGEVPYPYYITRSRYGWTGGAFRQNHEAEVFTGADKYGIPLMPPYSAKDPLK
jgi:hypothetical protein